MGLGEVEVHCVWGWGRRRCSHVKSELHSRNFNFIHVVFLRLYLLKTNTRSINVF